MESDMESSFSKELFQIFESITVMSDNAHSGSRPSDISGEVYTGDIESNSKPILCESGTDDGGFALCANSGNSDETVPSYKCLICLETNPTCGEFTLPCSHTFCRDCLRGYIISKVNDGCVNPRCCHVRDKPSDEGTSNSAGIDGQPKLTVCGVEIPPHIIKTMLADDSVAAEKYDRFKFMKTNKNARQCPHCDQFNIGHPETNTPKITCTSCEKDYCFYHSNAHDFTRFPTCELYEHFISTELQPNVDFISANSKPCPGCNRPVMKSGAFRR